MKVGDLVDLGPPRILLYGEVGAGKTALSLTLGERAQIADLDGGVRTGVSLKDDFTSHRKAVDLRTFPEPEPHKKATVFAKFKNYVYGLGGDIQRKTFTYDALIIDSLSALADSAVHYIMSNSGKTEGNPELQHWGLAFTEIKNVLAVARSLPIVLVVTAHEQVKSIGKGDSKEDKLEIALPGKNLASQICRYFDEIWYLRVRPSGGGKSQYLIQTRGNGAILARSRGGLADMTDTKVGMWELIRQIGYVPPTKETK